MAKKRRPKRLKPISLHPLSMEEALAAFMEVAPEKVEKRLIEDGVIKDRKSKKKV